MPLDQLPRTRRLDLSRIELPADHPAADLGRSVAVHGFLIEHPDGAILVDTGVGYGNTFIDELFRPSRVELAGLLAQLGIDVDAVVAVVNSHLHFDHCGQNPALFGRATTFYAQAAEIANVDPVPELQAAAVESIRRLKSLEPEVVHLSHCHAYVPSK